MSSTDDNYPCIYPSCLQIEKFALHFLNKTEIEELRIAFFRTPVVKLIGTCHLALEMLLTPLLSHLDCSKQNAFVTIPFEGSTLRDLVRHLSSHTIRRVAAVDSSGMAPSISRLHTTKRDAGKVVRILSQSTVIQYFAKHVRLAFLSPCLRHCRLKSLARAPT